jgi:hypothetical protein
MATKALGPVTYVISAGKEIDKYEGYTKTETYMADEEMGICDCQGFVNTGHCKHLDLKGLLSQFKTADLVFFGSELGDCKAKTEGQIRSLASDLLAKLIEHFKFESLELKELIRNPMDPTLYNSVKFNGKRKKNTLIVGYTHGIMFIVEPTPTG